MVPRAWFTRSPMAFRTMTSSKAVTIKHQEHEHQHDVCPPKGYGQTNVVCVFGLSEMFVGLSVKARGHMPPTRSEVFVNACLVPH